MKKYFLSFLLILVLFISSCGKKNTTSDNPSKKDEIVMKSIKVVSRSGKTITEDSVFVNQTETYKPNDIYVWVLYSDDTHKDVTSEATFQTVDIKTVGDKEVEVKYLEFKTKYILHVKENNVTDISIDYTNCNLIYPVDSLFSSSGLSVKAYYSNGTSTVINDYNLSIKDSNESLDEPLSIGKKTIVVSYANLKKEFEILVYKRIYTNNYNYKIDYILKDFLVDQDGKCVFKSKTEIINNDILKMNLSNVDVYTKESNGENVDFEFQNEKYNSYLIIPTKEGLEITLHHDTQVYLVASTLDNSLIYFKKDTNEYQAFGHTSNYSSLLYCELKAGTYQLISNKKNTRLYGISFDADSNYITGMNLDTTNVKTNYSLNEQISLNNLKVYATYSDNTSTLVDNSLIRYKIYNENNEVVTTLNQTGTYKVEISYSIYTKNYNIVVNDTRNFDNIILDINGVTKEFFGETFNYTGLKVYGLKDNNNILLTDVIDYKVELLYNNEVVSDFNQIGSYQVRVTYIGQGCINNVAYYNVNYSKTVSDIIIDTTNVKTNYIIGEQLDISNLIVKAKYSDNTYKDISLSSIERIIYKDNEIVENINSINEYKIVIKYAGFSKDFYIRVSDVVGFEVIELDTSKVTKEFIATKFNSNNLIVYGKKADGTKELISLDEIHIELTNEDIIYDDFSRAGTYKVSVQYIGNVPCENNIQYYDVTYRFKTIEFGYSGPNASDYDTWSEEVGNPIDYKSLVRVPNNNYIFMGFSPTFDDDFVKIYYDYKPTRVIYCYVSPRYEYIEFNYIGTQPNPEYLLPEETFVKYELDTTLSTDKYKLYYAVCSINSTNASVSLLSDNSANITFEGLNPTEVNVNVTDSNNNIMKVNSNNYTLNGLDYNKNYTINGYIVVDNVTYIVNEQSFSTYPSRTLTAITEDRAILNVSKSTLEIDCRPYLESLPSGYNIIAFQLLDDNNETMFEKAYTGTDTIYFTDLVPNTTYKVAVCYNKEDINTLSAKSVNYTYIFRFIGYSFLTYGDNCYRVRMQYQGDTLYTWYLSENNRFSTDLLCDFLLPKELSGYRIIGCETPLYNLESNIDVEIVLAKINSNEIVHAFYGFQGVLLKYEVLNKDIYPTYPTPPKTLSYYERNYTFTEWTISYDKDIKKYNALYKCDEINSNSRYGYELYIFNNKLVLEPGYCGIQTNYRTNIVYTILNKDMIDITNSLTLSGNYLRFFEGLTESTTYYLRTTVLYDLKDGNGIKQESFDYEFTTMSNNPTKNIVITYDIDPNTPSLLRIKTNKNNYKYVIAQFRDEISCISYFGTFDLGKLDLNDILYLYYCDVNEDNKEFKTYQIYNKVVTYEMKEVKDVEINYLKLIQNSDSVKVIIKGKNVSYINFSFSLDVWYPEAGDINTSHLLFGTPIADFEKKISDDEIIYDCHIMTDEKGNPYIFIVNYNYPFDIFFYNYKGKPNTFTTEIIDKPEGEEDIPDCMIFYYKLVI